MSGAQLKRAADLPEKELIKLIKGLVRDGVISLRKPTDHTVRTAPLAEYVDLLINVQKIATSPRLAVQVYLTQGTVQKLVFWLLYKDPDPQGRPRLYRD